MFCFQRAINVSVTTFSILFVALFFSSCNEYHRNKTFAAVPLQNIKKGKVLAQTYCGSCHSFPDPSWLDAKTWEQGVLPNMGPRLGIFQHGFNFYPNNRGDQFLDSNFYPAQPAINQLQWQYIIDYYTATSPDSLPGQQRQQSIQTGLMLFDVQAPANTYHEAATSFIKIGAPGVAQPLIISDIQKQKTYLYNSGLQLVDSFANSGPVVHMDFTGNELLACNIGRLDPNNGRFGKAQYIIKDAGGRLQETANPLFDSLQRPVQVSAADFNNDGRKDYLVCEFGFLTGALVWMEGLANNGFRRHVIKALPGAIKAYVEDYNNDGLQDFWVLMAQGEEGIWLYTNKGNGQFSAAQVLRFPSVYGSSYFELADMNSDGHRDIVYTAGDNADYSVVLKPYHGVYIYLNDGTNHFKQAFFFPMNGSYKAMARDYDGDGDQDIAAIAYFADYARQPEEGFVYLEHTGSLNFKPYTIPGVQAGRWLTMDAGDVDGDGAIDLVLGNFYMGPTASRSAYDWSKAPPFLVLKNSKK